MKKQTMLLLCLLLALALCALSGSAFADGDPACSYDAATHTLTLTGGDFNKDNNWGNDFTKSDVKHVNAQTGVRFVGDCRQLFNGFSSCTDIDLHNVDVSAMTFAWQIFTGAHLKLRRVQQGRQMGRFRACGLRQERDRRAGRVLCRRLQLPVQQFL